MYTSFFGLNEKPFAITPDPRYLFLSERHAEALAHLLYGINEAGGFIQLTGEVGTGKTTVVRSLLGQMPQNADVALILNPRITPAEFLLTICEELRLSVPDRDRGSVKEVVDILNRRLLAAHAEGRRVIVIVDEAQNLSAEVLEQVRLLTNLETATQKLLQIILIGQPELREVLHRVELRQLAQRITGRYHLDPLRREETGGYVRHRLRVAGATSDIFTAGALAEIHRLAGGIPRVINVICDRALLGGYTQDQHRINAGLVRKAVGEIYGRAVMPPWARWLALGGAVAGAVLLGIAVWRYAAEHEAEPSPATAVAANAPQAAAPAPEPVAARSPTLPELLQSRPPDPRGDAAFGRLLTLWGAPYTPGVDGCEQAAQRGLECVAQRGSWAQLRALNRPAILFVVDRGGERQIVLETLGDERGMVDVGGERRELSIAELSRYWYGDFVLLWRPQVPGVKQLSAGMRGEEVRWLRQSLERVRGAPASATEAADFYDSGLVRLVEDFQRQHRLTVDGIAGLQTQMVLDTALALPGTPLLSAPHEG